MASKKHLKVIRQGVKAWNLWQDTNAESRPNLFGAKLCDMNLNGAKLAGGDLSCADLAKAQLVNANLSRADLSRANLANANLLESALFGADLADANLTEADLSGANLTEANLGGANLHGSKLVGANLSRADFSGANLSGADLTGSDLRGSNFSGADLSEANLRLGTMGMTIFCDTDLRSVEGLQSMFHTGPSSIGVDTLFKSNGEIPEIFLLGAGIPEDFNTFIPSLVGCAIEFYSCFISYSHQDEEFSQRLHSRMRGENLRVWYAPEDMKGGRKLHEEIFRAIQIHDKLLLVLSENSMKSEWVTTEIRRARKVELEEKRRKLFPIRVVDFDKIRKWECFDADSGKDLAIELREYYIPDFSNWKDHDSFEAEFEKLLRDLKATADALNP